MTIDEAITQITYTLRPGAFVWTPEFAEAAKLGLEALKKWKVLREGRAGIIDPLLPGETEEVK